MIVIFILIGISLVIAISFLIVFFWAVKDGQYEDNYTPSVRILFDDESPVSEEYSNESNEQDKQKLKST